MSQTPRWVSSQKSHVWVFNVGRGLCIFIRTALNQGILYDISCSDDFSPSAFLKEHILPHLSAYKDCKVAQCVLSHPHSDHIADIDALCEPSIEKSPMRASLHTCPHDKADGPEKPEAVNFARIKNREGEESLVEKYRDMYAKRNPPLQTIQYSSDRAIPNVEYGLFYVRPPVVAELFPKDDQEYGNGLSHVLYYKHGFHTVLLTGDINPDTMKHLLDEGAGLEKRYTCFDRQKLAQHPTWHEKTGDQPSLKSLLSSSGLSVLLAPHHGLESGFSTDLYDAIRGKKPGLVVISEKRHLAENDGSVDARYQSEDGAVGQSVTIEGRAESRYSVSTRDGHHVLILFQGTGGKPEVFLEKDPKKLLDRANA